MHLSLYRRLESSVRNRVCVMIVSNLNKNMYAEKNPGINCAGFEINRSSETFYVCGVVLYILLII